MSRNRSRGAEPDGPGSSSARWQSIRRWSGIVLRDLVAGIALLSTTWGYGSSSALAAREARIASRSGGSPGIRGDQFDLDDSFLEDLWLL